jgi:hypothetical protein
MVLDSLELGWWAYSKHACKVQKSGTAALTSLRSILHASDSPCFLPLPKRMREEPLGWCGGRGRGEGRCCGADGRFRDQMRFCYAECEDTSFERKLQWACEMEFGGQAIGAWSGRV